MGITVESMEWLLLHCFQVELEFGNVGVCGGRKTGVPGEKTLGAGTRTNNKLNPHMTPSPAGPHWWEASALATAPSSHKCVLVHSMTCMYSFLPFEFLVSIYNLFAQGRRRIKLD